MGSRITRSDPPNYNQKSHEFYSLLELGQDAFKQFKNFCSVIHSKSLVYLTYSKIHGGDSYARCIEEFIAIEENLMNDVSFTDQKLDFGRFREPFNPNDPQTRRPSFLKVLNKAQERSLSQSTSNIKSTRTLYKEFYDMYVSQSATNPLLLPSDSMSDISMNQDTPIQSSPIQQEQLNESQMFRNQSNLETLRSNTELNSSTSLATSVVSQTNSKFPVNKSPILMLSSKSQKVQTTSRFMANESKGDKNNDAYNHGQQLPVITESMAQIDKSSASPINRQSDPQMTNLQMSNHDPQASGLSQEQINDIESMFQGVVALVIELWFIPYRNNTVPRIPEEYTRIPPIMFKIVSEDSTSFHDNETDKSVNILTRKLSVTRLTKNSESRMEILMNVHSFINVMQDEILYDAFMQHARVTHNDTF